MVTIYNTTLSATSQRHFSDGLGGVGGWLCRNILIISASKIENLPTVHDPRAV